MNGQPITKKVMAFSIASIIFTSIIVGIKLGTPSPPFTVLVNQVGYIPADQGKTFLVQGSIPIPAGSWELVDASTRGVAIQGDLSAQPDLWKWHYARGNFSSVQAPGTYYIKVHLANHGEVRSPVFRIGTDVLDVTFQRAYEFFYYQRCGCSVTDNVVPGYYGHKICHRDDATYPNGTFRETWGAWHDAGDYNKYNAYTPLSDYALGRAFLTNPSFFTTHMSGYPNSTGCTYHSNLVPDIVEEAMWGADFLVRMTLDNGSLYYCVGSNDFHGHYGFWGPPGSETDNDPATSFDNRKLWYDLADHRTAMLAGAALAQLSGILTNNGWFPSNATNYLLTAQKLYTTNQYYGGNPANGICNDSWEALLAACALYRVTGNAQYLDHANVVGDLLTTAYSTNLISAAQCGVDQPITAIVEWTNVNESVSVRQRVVDMLERRWNIFWYPATFMHDPANNFNILQENATANPDINVAGVTSNISYFLYRPDIWNVGHNSYYLNAAEAALLAYNLTADWKYVNFALRMFDWVLGRNPFGICLMESVGTFNTPYYHNRLCWQPGNWRGAVPGAVANGIAREHSLGPSFDYPYYDLTPSTMEFGGASYETNEPWLPHNCYYLLAAANLYNIVI